MSTDDASAALTEIRTTLLVVGTRDADGTPHWMIANWGTQASFDPWRYVLAVKKSARTLENLRTRTAFTVNLLDANARPLVKELMKGQGAAGGDGATGAPRLASAYAGLDCRLVDVHDVGGDHVLVAADVEDGWKRDGGPALTLGDLKLSYGG